MESWALTDFDPGEVCAAKCLTFSATTDVQSILEIPATDEIHSILEIPATDEIHTDDRNHGLA